MPSLAVVAILRGFPGKEGEGEVGRLNEYEVTAHVVLADDRVGGRGGEV